MAASARAGRPAQLLLVLLPQVTAPTQSVLLVKGALLVSMLQLEGMAPMPFVLMKSTAVLHSALPHDSARPTLYHSDNQLQIVPSPPYQWVGHTKAHARQRAVPLSNLAPPTLFHLDRRLQTARFLPFRSVEPTKASVRHRLDAHTWPPLAAHARTCLKSPVTFQNAATMLRARTFRCQGLATDVRVTPDMVASRKMLRTGPTYVLWTVASPMVQQQLIQSAHARVARREQLRSVGVWATTEQMLYVRPTRRA